MAAKSHPGDGTFSKGKKRSGVTDGWSGRLRAIVAVFK